MTLEEARALLAVDRAAPKDTVRRAYLRLLKKHKPERDPDGFERLRRAYELAVDFAPEGDPAPRAAPKGEPPVIAVREHRGVELPPPDPVPAGGGESAPPPKAREPSAWDHVRAALRAVHLGKFVEAEEGAVAGALAAGRSGEEIASEPFRTIALQLYARGEAMRARRVATAYDAYLRLTGNELQLLHGHGAVEWGFVRELARLPITFPDAALVTLAKAIVAPEDERRVVLDQLTELDRPSYDRAVRLLRAHAPLLAAAISDVLPPVEPAPAPSRGPDLWRVAPLIVAVLLAALRACAR